MPARRHLIAGVAMAAVLALAACGSGKSSSSPTVTATVTQTVTATPSASATTSTKTSPSASPSATTASCTTAQLGARVRATDAGAGQRYGVVVLTNIKSTPCTVFGYPGLQLLSATGANVPTRVVRVGSPKPKLVTIAPGASASSAISFGVVPTGSEPSTGACEATPLSVLVTPPDRTTSRKVPWNLGPVCAKGRIATNALVAGTGS